MPGAGLAGHVVVGGADRNIAQQVGPKSIVWDRMILRGLWATGDAVRCGIDPR